MASEGSGPGQSSDHGAVAGPPRTVAGNTVATPMSAHRRILEFRSPTGQSPQELVRATEEHALQLTDRLLSVKNGTLDAGLIHEIAIDSLTLLCGMAVPLLRELSGIQVASEPSAETETVAKVQRLDPNTPSTPAAATPRTSVACIRGGRAAQGSTPSSLLPSSESSRSLKDSNGMVLDLSRLSQIGVHASSRNNKRPRDESRRNCVHAPFTMRFNNFLFQGRVTNDKMRNFIHQGREPHEILRHAASKVTRTPDRERMLEDESIQPVRLFPDRSEPGKASSCAAGESSHPGIRTCTCCSSCESSNPFSAAQQIGGGCCRGASSEAVTVSMDGCVVEDDDWEDWGVAKYQHDDAACRLRYNTSSSPDHVQPSKDATPPWAAILGDLDDAVYAAYLPDPDSQGPESQHSHSHQPAERDPGGEDRRYGAPWLRSMDVLERELRATFQLCERDRLQAARRIGWYRRDIDWVKPSQRCGPQEDGSDSRMALAAVQVPRVGPRKKEASSSGMVCNSTVRHRRLRIAEARLLYLCAAIREHHEGSLIGGTGDELRLAAVKAILSDLPLEFLRCLAKDPRVQDCAVISAKRMRKKVLKELKAEAAAARKDPMTVLKATIAHSSRAGSIQAYRGMEEVLNKSGFGHCLPSADQMASAKKGIMRLVEHDLELYETPDGYRISLRRAVEMEASRIMQTVATTDSGRVTVRSVGVQPGGHGWQDFFDIKITFDARRVTRHGSQTEVMLVFIPKGKEGVDRCQKAVHHRTIAIWAGKDSKENVQRNLVEMLAEAKKLEEEGIVFSVGADSFLTVQESNEYAEWLKRPESDRNRMKQRMDEASFHNVGIRFWVPADMLAQCSLLGQGCAGNLYCPHCSAHKATRHIPFELHRVKESVNFIKFADSVDMKAETLWTINTCEDRGQNWKFSEEGLRFMTAPSSLVVQVPSAPAAPKGGSAGCTKSGKGQGTSAAVQKGPAAVQKRPAAVQKGPAAVQKGPALPAPAASTISKKRKSKAQPKPPVSTTADCVSTSNRDSTGRVLGPDKLSDRLTSWRSHGSECKCDGCMIPANTVVRIMLTPGFSRKSEFLTEHWPQMTSARCPFCALHCLMRVTEALFQQICQFGMAGGEDHLQRLNEALASAGFKSKKFEKLRHFESKDYEKLSFLGHESLHLLKRTDGERNIALILKKIWPQGDAPERVDEVNGERFVARSIDLWEQWAKVVELMTERDPEEVRKKNGFADFGKECLEFCFLFQAMFHKTQCKAFYLHTLMAHAGDFMRELEKHGMCLGMMSNSGAERRHEYGRRAFKRSLCGGCWAKHDEALALKRNLSAFLTLREVLTWQYGADLWTHEMATRAARNSGDAMETGAIESRRHMVQKALAELAEKNGRPPLLSMEEAEKELQDGSDLDQVAPCLETGSEGWVTVRHDSSKALEWVPCEDPRDKGKPLDPWETISADGSVSVLVGRDTRLTNGIHDWLSDCSGKGSDDGSDSDDGSEPDARFADLGDFESDADDEDYDPAKDRRIERVLELVRSDKDGADRLEADDLELIQRSDDGLWTARAAGHREDLPCTRSSGQQTSAGILRECTESQRKRRREKEAPSHWGTGPTDVILG